MEETSYDTAKTPEEEESSSEEEEDASVRGEGASTNESVEEMDDSNAEGKWKGKSLTHRVMTHWVKRKDIMIHDYSLVGHLLSPNSKIIADAISSKSARHVDAVNRLICKLMK